MVLLSIFCGGMMAQDLNPSDNGITPYSRYGYGTLGDNSFAAS